MVRVLGIDPGIASTGYGLVAEGPSSGLTLLVCGVIRTRARTPMPRRLAELHEQLRALIAEADADAVAVEELFFAANVSTAMAVGQARGIVLLAAAQSGLPVAEYKPNEIKVAVTGYGGADKRQMQDMLRLLLDLDAPPRPDDAADGAAVALCHLRMARLRELEERD